MKCPFCNQEHPSNTKFCPETGNKIEQSSLTCSSCGFTGIPVDSKFCPNCGHPFEETKGEGACVPSCPKCYSDNVTDDGSGYLQYRCKSCGNTWGHCHEECPECESTDVEDDGYGYLQYTCNNCGHNWGDAQDDEDSQDDEEDTPSCPKCHSDNVTDDGSDYLQYECNDCGNTWGHCHEECPECESTDVEDDGYGYLQYTCNNCGHNWGDATNDDIDKNEDYIIDKFFPVAGITLEKSTIQDAEQHKYLYDKIEYCDSGVVIAWYKGIQIRKEAGCNLFTDIYITSYQSMFPKWVSLGFSWDLSYDGWISVFKKLGFKIVQTKHPRIESWEHGPDYFSACFVAIANDDTIKFELDFAFNRDGGKYSISRKTLYSISVTSYSSPGCGYSDSYSEIEYKYQHLEPIEYL